MMQSRRWIEGAGIAFAEDEYRSPNCCKRWLTRASYRSRGPGLCWTP